VAENSTIIDVVSGPGYVAPANAADWIPARSGIHQAAVGAAFMVVGSRSYYRVAFIHVVTGGQHMGMVKKKIAVAPMMEQGRRFRK
jgi:hypothetical protein